VLHHKVFDLGVFTLNPEGMLLVSDQAHGTTGFEESLLRFHGGPVHAPQRPEYRPRADYTNWHVREVFKGESRHWTPGEAGSA
jgi:putative restriction endonuclease